MGINTPTYPNSKEVGQRGKVTSLKRKLSQPKAKGIGQREEAKRAKLAKKVFPKASLARVLAAL